MHSNKDWRTCFWTSQRSWTTLSLRILSLRLWSLTKASKQTTSWRRPSPPSDSVCKRPEAAEDRGTPSEAIPAYRVVSFWLGLGQQTTTKVFVRNTCARKTDVRSAPLTQCLGAVKETCSQSKLSPVPAPQALYLPPL